MRKIIVIGNLNVDLVREGKGGGTKATQSHSAPMAGGTAFNAAVAFQDRGFDPILLANIGHDRYGQMVAAELRKRKLTNMLRVDASRPTGICEIEYTVKDGEEQRHLKRNKSDANVYDPDQLAVWLQDTVLAKDDLIFVASDFVTRNSPHESKRIFELLHSASDNLIVDLVPHTIHQKLTLDSLKSLLPSSLAALIAELKTLMYLIDPGYRSNRPSPDDWQTVFHHFHARYIGLRYGKGEISKQQIARKAGKEIELIQEESDTGYDRCTTYRSKRGFGDRLTAEFVYNYL